MFPEFNTYYQNFSLDNPTVSLTVIIWAICIGLAAGTVFYTVSKHAAGSLVKKLSRGEHYTKENTATLESLGVKPSLSLKRALRDGQPLRKYIVIANPDECRIEKKKNFFHTVYRYFRREDMPAVYDVSKAELYLPEQVRHTAEIRYETKGHPLLAAIIACVLFLLIGAGLSFCMPKLLELVDSMITAYKNL